ncbi:MAG: protein kinase [Gemmatimonadetes bacterium]|nr:protein kinase [Gemmatimonadota bacterium]
MSGIEGLLRGRVLADRYRIAEVIGRGGMGAVYRATDERLGRDVAVKIITVGSMDPDGREHLQERFLREARAAAALPHHPNVVPVYDFGTDPDLGLDFLVMELLRGEDLATRLTRVGPPPLAAAIRILHEAARGIAVGHRAGLVHRDVKPGNIFLAQGDHAADVEIRVLDFGIAKLADDDSLSQLTRDGRTPLSPAYASPEQLRGLSRITLASDVFSLGAVGYQLLTGERAFTEADRNRMSLGMPVPAPSPRERNPAIPPAVDDVVRRALAFEAEERYPDAGTFASVLEQARREMGNAPLPPYDPDTTAFSATTPPAPPRGAARDDRTEFLDDRTLLDPGAAPAAAASARSTPPPERPPLPRRREGESRGTGWLLAALILILLLGAGAVFAWWTLNEPRTVVVDRLPPPPPELPTIEPSEPLEDLGPATELDAYMNNTEGERFYRQGNFDVALEQFERAVEISPGNPDYRYNLALTLLRLEAMDEAVRQFERVIRQDPNRAGAHFYVSEAYLARADTAAAINALETVLQVSTDPRQRGITERRLRDIRSAVLQSPAPEPIDPVPPMDTVAVQPSAAQPALGVRSAVAVDPAGDP